MVLELLLLSQLAASPSPAKRPAAKPSATKPAVVKRLPRGTLPRPAPVTAPTTRIDLVVRTSGGETKVTALPTQPQPEPRPLALMRVGEKPQIRYLVTNLSATTPVTDLAVHLLVFRAEAAGEKIPPGPRKGTVLDTVLGTDIAAKRSTSGNYNTAIFQPGIYLVELELLDPNGNRRQYCALDLKVE